MIWIQKENCYTYIIMTNNNIKMWVVYQETTIVERSWSSHYIGEPIAGQVRLPLHSSGVHLPLHSWTSTSTPILQCRIHGRKTLRLSTHLRNIHTIQLYISYQYTANWDDWFLTIVRLHSTNNPICLSTCQFEVV